MKQRKLKVWTKEELQIIKNFFSEARTADEKLNISKQLSRSWNAIYNKNWSLSHPESIKKANRKYVEKHATKDMITVSHVKLPFTTLRIGECVIETHSTKIKVNNTLLEM